MHYLSDPKHGFSVFAPISEGHGGARAPYPAYDWGVTRPDLITPAAASAARERAGCTQPSGRA
jgi:hypothetical protein